MLRILVYSISVDGIENGDKTKGDSCRCKTYRENIEGPSVDKTIGKV